MSRLAETWRQHRKRMLDETSRFIEWGLKHPDLVIEIPAKPVGESGFPKGVGEWFWGIVLSTNTDSKIQFWRDMLLRRPMQFLQRRR